MLHKNYSEASLERLNNSKKKVLVLSKIENKNMPKIKKKKIMLFDDPKYFLKLPKEMNFNFIIGKKSHATEQNSERIYTKYKTNSFMAKRKTRIRSISSISSDLHKPFESSNIINEEQNNILKKKRQFEILKIFSNLRKRINNSETQKKDRNIELSKEIPSFI